MSNHVSPEVVEQPIEPTGHGPIVHDAIDTTVSTT